MDSYSLKIMGFFTSDGFSWPDRDHR